MHVLLGGIVLQALWYLGLARLLWDPPGGRGPQRTA
jgi:hypothetical protein